MAVLFDLVTILSAIVVVLVLAFIFLLRWFRDRVAELESKLEATDRAKRSQAATYGRITEQFAPLLENYPFDPRNFRFLGNPVDGVQFEEDRIVFVEIKANRSRLSPGEQRIRQLVEAGRVEWYELRAEADGTSGRAPEPSAHAQEGPEYWRREP